MKMQKKILAAVLAVITVLVILPVCALAESYYLGDADGNGKVEATDALKVLKYTVGLDKNIITKRADVNRDGKIDAADALVIVQISVGLKKATVITEQVVQTTTKPAQTTANPVQTTTKPAQTTTKPAADTVHKAKPIGKVSKTWEMNKANFYAKIERLSYGKEHTMSVNAGNVANYNTQIVNYKTFKYWAMANVAVITPKNGTLLRFSKGTTGSDPETLAKSVGAELAINGVCTYGGSDSYLPKAAATVRDGAIYKAYTGAAGKAETRMVIYKNGDWKKITNFDNATAKAEIAKGAWISVPYMDLTIYEGKITSHFRKADGTPNETYYRNRTFVGHTYDGKILFVTTEMMPVCDAAQILIAYNCKDAVFLNGGNSTYMYAKGFGNTTGTTGASVKNLNKIGYLETEWYAKYGLLAAGKGGGPSHTDLDVAYFK